MERRPNAPLWAPPARTFQSTNAACSDALVQPLGPWARKDPGSPGSYGRATMGVSTGGNGGERKSEDAVTGSDTPFEPDICEI